MGFKPFNGFLGQFALKERRRGSHIRTHGDGHDHFHVEIRLAFDAINTLIGQDDFEVTADLAGNLLSV